MKLKALVVDDENLARENLKMMLTDFCPEIEVVGEAGDIEEAKVKFLNEKPDVLFLDIRMPSGAEGFELLESLKGEDFMVVFVTAFKDFAVRAFNANAVHYVLKPIDIDDLQNSVQKLIETKKQMTETPEMLGEYKNLLNNFTRTMRFGDNNGRITISHSKGFKIVDEGDITHLEANGNCTTLNFNEGNRYLDTRTLKIYEEMLPKERFFRVHKSHIINLKYLKEYLSEDGHFAVLKGGERIPIARNRVSNFLSLIKSF